MRRAVYCSLLLLGACSGSDGGSVTPTPTPNTAPVFTSSMGAIIVENTAVAYQATAIDAEGNPITFSISGGVDAARFTITPDGKLSFVAPPDFEEPDDADRNHQYEVQLRASDGLASSTLSLSVAVTNSTEGIRVRTVATGLDQLVLVAPVPGDATRVFAASRTGNVYFVNNVTATTTTAFVADVGSPSQLKDEQGVLGLAARPDFATSGVVYVCVATATDSVEIREYTIGSSAYRTVLTTPPTAQYVYGNYGGWIGFGPDGYLYAATGDSDTPDTAQDPNSRLGKILRVKIDAAAGSPTPFAPAPGNPFIGGGGDPYVFAMGLRNPGRASFDGDRLIIGDGNQGSLQEINTLKTDQPGVNFGWPFLDAIHPRTGTAPAGLTAPAAYYGSDDFASKFAERIIGGFVYRGSIAALQGMYFFADRKITSGGLWTLTAADTAALTPSSPYRAVTRLRSLPDVPGGSGPLRSIGIDGANNLYLVGYDSIRIVEPDPDFAR